MLARRLGALAAGLVLGWAVLGSPLVALAQPDQGARRAAKAAPGEAAAPGEDDSESVTRGAGHRYQLTMPGGWTATDPAGAPADVLAGYRHHDSGARVVITRADYPNPAAWRQQTAFFEQVEAGLQASTPGYARLHRRQMRLDRIPAMDLGFRRRAGGGAEVVHMRFLFFRRYTLALVLVAPVHAHRRHQHAYRKLIDGFVPYLGA